MRLTLPGTPNVLYGDEIGFTGDLDSRPNMYWDSNTTSSTGGVDSVQVSAGVLCLWWGWLGCDNGCSSSMIEPHLQCYKTNLESLKVCTERCVESSKTSIIAYPDFHCHYVAGEFQLVFRVVSSR